MADKEAQRKKRQEALDGKRKRLEEMKKSRQEKDDKKPAPPKAKPSESKSNADGEGTPTSSGGGSGGGDDDDLIANLLNMSMGNDYGGSSSLGLSGGLSGGSSLLGSATILSTAMAAPPAPVDKKAIIDEYIQEKKNALTRCRGAAKVFIPPYVPLNYEKGCQTNDIDDLKVADFDDPNATPATPKTGVKFRNTIFGILSAAKSKSIKEKIDLAMDEAKDCANSDSKKTKEAEWKKPERVFSEEEIKTILNEDVNFSSFLSKSSLVMERVIEQNTTIDILKDFSTASNSSGRRKSANDSLLINNTYEDDLMLKNRPLMDLQASPHEKDLFLAAYGAKVNPYHGGGSGSSKHGSHHAMHSATAAASPGVEDEDAPGVVCIWSKDLHKRPEFRFLSASPITAALFHGSEQQLVVGGCYSGQILLWDMRAKSFPVQRSSMSGKGHKHPIFAMSMISLAVSCELVSVSIDGMVCHWDVSRLAEPLTVTYLNVVGPSSSLSSSGMGSSRSAEVSLSGGMHSFAQDALSTLNITAMAFGQTELSGQIVLGCGTGQIYRTALPYRASETIYEAYSHYGLVTSIHAHPGSGKHHKPLVLTSSLDWTVKLWNIENFHEPIFEFFNANYDYVSDAQWSPINPCMFCTITSGGVLALWNLAQSITEPIDNVKIIRDTEDGLAAGGGGSAGTVAGAGSSANIKQALKSSTAHGHTGASVGALNKCIWSRDGLTIYVGDSLGAVHTVSVDKKVAASNASDESKFEMLLMQNKRDPVSAVSNESKIGGAGSSGKISSSSPGFGGGSAKFGSMRRLGGGVEASLAPQYLHKQKSGGGGAVAGFSSQGSFSAKDGEGLYKADESNVI